MLTTIKGVYEQGHIFMKEEPPVNTKTEVFITFLTQDQELDTTGKRVPGGLKGRVTIPDDFNETLEDFKDYM